MKTTQVTTNGKFTGVIYELTDGRKIYLAHRQLRHLHKVKASWCIEDYILRNVCKREGIEYVGVLIRQKGTKLFYLTPIADFFDPAKSFTNYGKSVERALPSKLFLLNPNNRMETLEKLVRVVK